MMGKERRSALKLYEYWLMMKYFNAYALLFCATSALEAFHLRRCVNISRYNIIPMKQIFFPVKSDFFLRPIKQSNFISPKIRLIQYVGCTCIYIVMVCACACVRACVSYIREASECVSEWVILCELANTLTSYVP